MDATEKQLVLELFRKMVDLQIELAVCRDILQTSRLFEKESSRELSWQETVKSHRKKIDSKFLGEWYSDIQEQLQSSTLGYPESILLLTALAERQIVTR